MANQQSNTPILPPHPSFPYVLGGIHDGIYDQAKHYWNCIHSRPPFSLDFYFWCVHNWMDLHPVHTLACSYNFDYFYERPYKYYLAMVIVGAVSELENFRYEWSYQDANARLIIGALYNIRTVAAQFWDEHLEFDDSEIEYDREANEE